MKLAKNERIAERLLSENGETAYIITQSLTDPPRFTLYKIKGEEKTKLQTAKSPLELQEIWRNEKPKKKE